jgi:hypothetical protein
VNGLFAPCAPPQTQLTNPGVYVLTVLPASGYQGQAPVTQLGSAGVATSCSSRYHTAGVQFRLSPVTLASTGSGLQPTLYALANKIQAQLNTGAAAAALAPQLSQLRNGLAHLCFGTDTLAAYAANPLAGLPGASIFEAYGLVDAQRGAKLITDCEVPLALAYWTQQGIQFLDIWSVRRPVVAASASEEWPLFSGRRRWTEGLAMFLQFQAQVEDLMRSSPNPLAASATEAPQLFFYLPPVGVLPISGIAASNGVNYTSFFAGNTYRGPQFIEGARLDAILNQAFYYPRLDVSDQVMVWLYWVRENIETINTSQKNVPNAYVVLVNGQLPNFGDARYDVNRWDYSTYA